MMSRDVAEDGPQPRGEVVLDVRHEVLDPVGEHLLPGRGRRADATGPAGAPRRAGRPRPRAPRAGPARPARRRSRGRAGRRRSRPRGPRCLPAGSASARARRPGTPTSGPKPLSSLSVGLPARPAAAGTTTPGAPGCRSRRRRGAAGWSRRCCRQCWCRSVLVTTRAARGQRSTAVLQVAELGRGQLLRRVGDEQDPVGAVEAGQAELPVHGLQPAHARRVEQAQPRPQHPVRHPHLDRPHVAGPVVGPLGDERGEVLEPHLLGRLVQLPRLLAVRDHRAASRRTRRAWGCR